MIPAVKGMRDFYPQDCRQREWLFDLFKEASLKSGFEFYDAPLVEYEDLYTRKAGEEISEQLYVFKDKSGRGLALRPEMTPSLARMIIQRQKELPGIIKWFSIPQCFRYERMTRGRKREHYQWNLDYLGEKSMIAEMEVIATALHVIEGLGLSAGEVKVRISNRKLFAELLGAIQIPDFLHQKVFLVIDKLGKMPDESLVDLMAQEGIALESGQKVIELVRRADLEEISKILKESDGLEEIKFLFQLLENYGYGGYLEFDLSVVRGLAYYTGTVFEFFDAGKSLRAIAGGGRYDQLISTMSGKKTEPLSAVGFGFGDVVIQELLSDLGLIPELAVELDYYLAPMETEDVASLVSLLKPLRAAYTVQMHYPPQKFKKVLQRAEKLGAKKIIMVQKDRENQICVKSLDTFEEDFFSFEEFISSLQSNH